MNKNVKLALYGFLVWLLPFLLSFLFYSREGTLLVDIFLFKSIMLVFSGLVGVGLMIFYFKEISTDFLNEGIKLGAIWLIINFVLDLAILLPISGDTIGNWFACIGMRYLMIPIYSIGIGYLLQLRK